jgi:hypothetical protein
MFLRVIESFNSTVLISCGPETLTVGVPALVPIMPVVVLARLPVIDISEFRLSVVPVPTVTLLLIVFVPAPENVVVPVPEVARL